MEGLSRLRKEKKEDKSGTSLFHQLMAQRKDVDEDVVCISLQKALTLVEP